MLVAVPNWNGRVSPLFDTATRLTLAEVSGGRTAITGERLLAGIPPPWRARYLADQGVEVLICGGISRPLAGMLGALGIRVLPWVTGEVSEVLEAFAGGRLPAPQFLMPGCGRHRHRFRHGLRPWWR